MFELKAASNEVWIWPQSLLSQFVEASELNVAEDKEEAGDDGEGHFIDPQVKRCAVRYILYVHVCITKITAEQRKDMYLKVLIWTQTVATVHFVSDRYKMIGLVQKEYMWPALIFDLLSQVHMTYH